MNYNRANLPEEADPKGSGALATPQYAIATRDPYSVGAYVGPTSDAPRDFQVDLSEYLRILIKRRRMILAIVAASLALGAIITLMKTPLYTSTVRLQIDQATAKIVEGGNIAPVEGPYAEFMRTQYELLQGRALAERVAATLKLGRAHV